MFTNYEPLVCSKCIKLFNGRKPAENGYILCPDCLKKQEIPVINQGDNIPEGIYAECEGGKGEDD